MTRCALVFVVIVAASGCGGGNDEASPAQFTGASLELQDPGPVHVHGLGYDSETKTLYIATHTGLFELGSGSRKARRIGDSHQDTMGFSLVRPDLFLGSGHPDARDQLPPHLGLIKSTDRGRSWESTSLLGEADFHVLRASGRTVYGFDSSHERLLTSSDSGLTWTRRPLPEPLVDLAIDPRDPQHLLASGGAVLYRSTDGALSWHVVASGVSGYLAWLRTDRVYVATLDGTFLTAPGATNPWRSRSSLPSPPAAALAIDDRTIYVALHDGTIERSTDGGTSWTVASTP